MSCHIQAKNMNFLWDRMTDSNPLQEANSIKSLSPKGAGLLKLCQSSFANLQLTFVFLSLVDVPSAFQFTPLLTSIDYQVQNMTSSPWKSVCGTISLQETNWSLSRRRSVQTNQWQLDDEWKTLRSIRKVYLSNTGEKCKNMKGAREGGEVFRDKTDWHGFTFTYMCRLSSWFMEKHYGFTREDTHILARECMFIYSDKRRLSPDPPPRVAPCNDVQMVAARCPLIRHRDCSDWKNTSFHLTLPLFSVCFHYFLIHDNALYNYAFKIFQFQKIWWGSSSSFILFKFCMVI